MAGRTPYKMYHRAADVHALDTHGQSWSGETIEENIALCGAQTIEPVLMQHLRPGMRVLESGCGLGRWVFYLRRRGIDITGIDLAQDALEAVRAFDPEAPIMRDDVLHSTFTDESFDAAISLGVVEHFEDGPQTALAELRRLLKDHGILFISVPTQNLLRLVLTNRLKEFYRWIRSRRGERFVFEEYRYTRHQFSAELGAAGFRIISMTPDDFRPPRNIGLYVDFPFFRDRTRKWELNAAGRFVRAFTDALSPWWTCAGTLWVVEKKGS